MKKVIGKQEEFYKEHFEICKKAATQVHMGQVRTMGEDKGKPYILHPERVAMECLKHYGYYHACVGMLHDCIEDIYDHKEKTAIGFMKEWGIESTIIETVKILSKKQGETYYDFIYRVVKSQNLVAMEVKYEDIYDNMKSLEEGSLKDKYRFAIDVVTSEIQSVRECRAIVKGILS